MIFALHSADAFTFCRLNQPSKTAECQHKYGPRRSGSRICVAGLDEQIQIGIHRIADVGRYAAEVDALSLIHI